MNPRALDRLNHRQLLELNDLALRMSAWCQVASLLSRLGMPAMFALQRARQYRELIRKVTE